MIVSHIHVRWLKLLKQELQKLITQKRQAEEQVPQKAITNPVRSVVQEARLVVQADQLLAQKAPKVHLRIIPNQVNRQVTALEADRAENRNEKYNEYK